MIRIVFLAVIVIAIAGPVIAASGTNTMQFLRLGVSPRIEGMAGVFWGNDDAFNLWYNPASLAKGNTTISLSYRNWLADLTLSSFDTRIPVYTGGLGIGLIYHDLGSVAAWDSYGNPGEPIQPSEMALGIGFGSFIGIGSGLAGGIALKYARSKLDDDDLGESLLGDLSLMYDKNGVQLGVSIKNIGTKVKSGSRKDPVPTDLHLGGVFPISIDQDAIIIRFGSDADFPLNEAFRFGLGGEVAFHNTIFLRMGYKGGSELESITGGIGINLNGMVFDYAFGPLDQGTDLHLFSLSVSLNAFSDYFSQPSIKASVEELEELEASHGILKAITYSIMPDLVNIRIDVSSVCEVRDFSLSDPKRIVIDLDGLNGLLVQPEIIVGQLGIEAIRSAVHEDYVRVVIDISTASDYRIQNNGYHIMVQIR